MNVPTAQLDATNALVLSPRMTPTPAPLAIPLRRLLRAHGISPIFWRSSEKEILYLARRVSASAVCAIGAYLVGLMEVGPVVRVCVCLEEDFLRPGGC